MSLPPVFEARLVRKRRLSPDVCELAFERCDGAPMAFVPGQWVSLLLPLMPSELRRAYSIASPPGATSEFQLAVTRVEGGPGSCFLHEMQPGTSLSIIGPQGFFTRLPKDENPALFVGTGTGVTPLRSMLRSALSAGSTTPMRLVFGVRREAEILYRDEFEALASAHPNFRVVFTLSREEWAGRRGYVQVHVRELWEELSMYAPPHVYICGLHKMVGAVRDLLRKEMGVSRQQVHSERYD